MSQFLEKRIVEAKNHNVRRYYIRLADGLCTKCGKKRDNLTTRCEDYRKKYSDYAFNSYRRKKGVSLSIPKQQGRKL